MGFQGHIAAAIRCCCYFSKNIFAKNAHTRIKSAQLTWNYKAATSYVYIVRRLLRPNAPWKLNSLKHNPARQSHEQTVYYVQNLWNLCISTKKITFTLQFFSILEISPLLLPWKKSAKRLQIPRVKNGLLNVGTCNAYIVLFIPSFFVHYQDKNVWIVIWECILLQKSFLSKKKGDRSSYSLPKLFEGPLGAS